MIPTETHKEGMKCFKELRVHVKVINTHLLQSALSYFFAQ